MKVSDAVFCANSVNAYKGAVVALQKPIADTGGDIEVPELLVLGKLKWIILHRYVERPVSVYCHRRFRIDIRGR